MPLKSVSRALRHRNYKLFFFGQGVSLIGTWMTQVATAWLVYRLTGSAFLLGVVGFSGQIATFLLAPVAGVFTDRCNRRQILTATQILSALQSLALAVLTLTHQIEVSHIIVLSICQGLISAFDIPARQAFLVEIVKDRADLGNAIALNSVMFNGARLVGPSIAGFVIAWGGEGICFLIDAVSYLSVIVTLLLLRLEACAVAPRHHRLFHELKEGISYAVNFLPIRAILLLVAFTSLAASYSVLFPVVARDVLQGGPSTLGFLSAATGCGALFGGLYLASRRDVRGLLRLIAAASFVQGASLMAFAVTRSLGVALAVLFVTGFSMIIQLAASNTVLQTLVDDDKRGRVMSLYMMALLGMTPWGSLLAGALTARAGIAPTLFLQGAASFGIAMIFAGQLPRLKAVIRPIYVKMGIIPVFPSPPEG